MVERETAPFLHFLRNIHSVEKPNHEFEPGTAALPQWKNLHDLKNVTAPVTGGCYTLALSIS